MRNNTRFRCRYWRSINRPSSRWSSTKPPTNLTSIMPKNIFLSFKKQMRTESNIFCSRSSKNWGRKRKSRLRYRQRFREIPICHTWKICPKISWNCIPARNKTMFLNCLKINPDSKTISAATQHRCLALRIRSMHWTFAAPTISSKKTTNNHELALTRQQWKHLLMKGLRNKAKTRWPSTTG